MSYGTKSCTRVRSPLLPPCLQYLNEEEAAKFAAANGIELPADFVGEYPAGTSVPLPAWPSVSTALSFRSCRGGPDRRPAPVGPRAVLCPAQGGPGDRRGVQAGPLPA